MCSAMFTVMKLPSGTSLKRYPHHSSMNDWFFFKSIFIKAGDSETKEGLTSTRERLSRAALAL